MSPSLGFGFSICREGPNPNYKRSVTEGPKHSQDTAEYHLMKSLVLGSWHLSWWGSIHLASSPKEPVRGHAVGGGLKMGGGGGGGA